MLVGPRFSAPPPFRWPEQDRSLSDETYLLEKSPIVFEVPVFGDSSVGDPIDVGCDEIDFLTLSGLTHEAAGEVQVRDNSIIGDDHLPHFAAEVRHRSAKCVRGLQDACPTSVLDMRTNSSAILLMFTGKLFSVVADGPLCLL